MTIDTVCNSWLYKYISFQLLKSTFMSITHFLHHLFSLVRRNIISLSLYTWWAVEHIATKGLLMALLVCLVVSAITGTYFGVMPPLEIVNSMNTCTFVNFFASNLCELLLYFRSKLMSLNLWTVGENKHFCLWHTCFPFLTRKICIQVCQNAILCLLISYIQ